MKNSCLNSILDSKRADECETDLGIKNVDIMIKLGC